MSSRARSLIPPQIRRQLREATYGWRRSKLRRAFVELRREARGGVVSDEVLADVHTAWGTEGWTADLPYLSALVERMLDAGEDCLDCGSGLTTAIAGGSRRSEG